MVTHLSVKDINCICKVWCTKASNGEYIDDQSWATVGSSTIII